MLGMRTMGTRFIFFRCRTFQERLAGAPRRLVAGTYAPTQLDTIRHPLAQLQVGRRAAGGAQERDLEKRDSDEARWGLDYNNIADRKYIVDMIAAIAAERACRWDDGPAELQQLQDGVASGSIPVVQRACSVGQQHALACARGTEAPSSEKQTLAKSCSLL